MFTAFRNLFQMVETNVKHAGQTFSMAVLELKKRYSGSTLGTLWAVIRPSIFVFFYWFGIQVGIRGGKPIDGVPFLLWLIAGIVPWFYIADVLSVGGRAIVSNRHLVTKSVFPISTIPTFTILHLFFVHLVLLVIAAAIFLISGFGLSIYLLQVFYYMICLFVLMWITAVFFSACVVVSRDFDHMLRSISQMLFWFSPILWSMSKIRGTLSLVIKANPVAYVINGYRDCFVYRQWFFERPVYTLYFWSFIFVCALISCYLFKRLEKEFADIL